MVDRSPPWTGYLDQDLDRSAQFTGMPDWEAEQNGNVGAARLLDDARSVLINHRSFPLAEVVDAASLTALMSPDVTERRMAAAMVEIADRADRKGEGRSSTRLARAWILLAAVIALVIAFATAT